VIHLPSHVPTLTRRQFMKIGAVALSGFDLLPMMRPLNVATKEKVKPRGTAEFCVFVFLQGGASHLDTFDVKEGRWTPPDFDVRTLKPDIRLPVGLFPKLAQRVERVAIVRSMEAWETEHGRATYYLHVAHPVSPARVREMPSLGAVVAYEFREKRKSSDFMPPFVSMNYGSDQVKEGCLDSQYTPLNLDTRAGDFAFVVSENERRRFDRRVEYLKAMAALSPGASEQVKLSARKLDAYRGNALAMMQSPEIPKILRLDEEERKRYGGSPFGDACILARNILSADAGTRFIAINHGGWDFHLNIYDKTQKTNHYTLSRELDGGLAELIGDLEKIKTRDGHSLLDKTLIVCAGEFGRTPGDITVNKGRDHHRFAMSALFVGAGIVGGRAIGATDDQGARVVQPGWAKKRSIYPEDVAATLYSALGIDWTKEITNTPSGRVFQYVEAQSGTDFLDVSEIGELFA
jgi:uncharacterized protein (DUF1501 family)